MRAATLALAGTMALVASAGPNSRAEAVGQSKADPAKPQTERDYIAAIDTARAQFESAPTTAALTSARQGMQIRLHDLLGLNRMAHDWTGVLSDVHVLPDGRKSVEIRIEPEIVLATWQNAPFDTDYGTLIERGSPLYKRLTVDAIGKPVRFSAEILGARISSDDAMVEHPEAIARFSAIQILN